MNGLVVEILLRLVEDYRPGRLVNEQIEQQEQRSPLPRRQLRDWPLIRAKPKLGLEVIEPEQKVEESLFRGALAQLLAWDGGLGLPSGSIVAMHIAFDDLQERP